MNMDQTLDKLAKRAREAKAPEVDVVDRVMEALELSAVAAPGLDPFFWVAGASTIAAVVVVILSATSWGTLTDPLVAAVLEVMGAIG